MSENYKIGVFILLGIDQTNRSYTFNDQGRVYQTCKFHHIRTWYLVLGSGHKSHIIIYLKIYFTIPVHRSDKLNYTKTG